MRTLDSRMVAHLQGETTNLCMLWQITLTTGQMLSFTDHDTDLSINGVYYSSAAGFDATAIQGSSDLSTANMEVQALLTAGLVTRAQLEAGLWNYAAVRVLLGVWSDGTIPPVSLMFGRLGQFTLTGDTFKAEMRGIAQVLQQTNAKVISPTCRASLGDSKCRMDMGPLTFNGTVTGVTSTTQFADTSRQEAGPNVAYVDSRGYLVPNSAPYIITPVAPQGGTWASKVRVRKADGSIMSGGNAGSNPSQGIYMLNVVNGVPQYQFSSADFGLQVFIDFNYTTGFFTFGKVTFTTGQNAGLSMEVKGNGPGSFTLAMPLPYPIAVGDAYTVQAGCDRQRGTCITRFNNLLNFRGEPFVPGNDTMVRPQHN